MYLCAEKNGHERNSNEDRNEEHDEPSNPVQPAVQSHHIHILLEKVEELDVTQTSAQSHLVQLSSLLQRPKQTGMRCHELVLESGD